MYGLSFLAQLHELYLEKDHHLSLGRSRRLCGGIGACASVLRRVVGVVIVSNRWHQGMLVFLGKTDEKLSLFFFSLLKTVVEGSRC